MRENNTGRLRLPIYNNGKTMTRQERIKARIQDYAENYATNGSYSLGDHMKKFNISESTAKKDLKRAKPIAAKIGDQMFEIEYQKWLDSIKQQ